MGQSRWYALSLCSGIFCFGDAKFRGSLGGKRINALRGDRMAMIFQEPMTALNPVLTAGYQIAEELSATHKVSLAVGSRQTPLPQRLARLAWAGLDWRYPAGAPEKAMRDAGNVQGLGRQPLHRGNPATSLMAGGTKARALNRVPICAGSIRAC